MKLKNLFVAALVLIAGLSSCKKETSIDPVTPATPVASNARLLLASADTYNSYTFEYNVDKTIKAYTVNGARYEFSYQPNKLTEMLYISNQKRGELVHELIKGIAQKLTGTYYDVNGNISETNLTLYTYNAKGLLTQEQYTKNGAANGAVYRSYDNNDDMILLEVKDKNGITTWKSEFEFDLALTDKSGSFGQFNTSVTGSVFPKIAQHLMKKQTVTENNVISHYYHSYAMDGSGYVLSGITKDDSNITVGTWTNTWE